MVEKSHIIDSCFCFGNNISIMNQKQFYICPQPSQDVEIVLERLRNIIRHARPKFVMKPHILLFPHVTL